MRGVDVRIVMKLLLFAAAIGVCLSSATLDEEWEVWKSLYSKVYDDEATSLAEPPLLWHALDKPVSRKQKYFDYFLNCGYVTTGCSGCP